MSQTIACGCNPPRLFGLVDACGNPLSIDNPLFIKGDTIVGWSLQDVIYAEDGEIYYGFPTIPASDQSDPLCAILKIETVGNVITRKWSGGTMDKIHLWSNRLTLEYHFLS